MPWEVAGLAAVLLLGARSNRYRKDGAISAHPRQYPFLALGAWILTVAGLANVMSARPSTRSPAWWR